MVCQDIFGPHHNRTYARGVHIVLVHPEIAPNTGAIIRLCANTGSDLHLIEPLGFSLDDRRLKRGGLDYHEYASIKVHPSLEDLIKALPGRSFGFSSKAERTYTDVSFASEDLLIFGAERNGLSNSSKELIPHDRVLLIPMREGNRSLNLANAVSIVVYEAWRQTGFPGASRSRHGLTAETIGAEPFDT